MLSAIIPTHDRPTLLRQCLQTLQAQDVGSDQLEIVVVDDGSTADVAAVAAAVAREGRIPIRYERQEGCGLNSARNRGAAAASGDIFAFLDDDTLASPGWARAILNAFDTYGCAAVGGRVELKFAHPAPEWMDNEWRCYLAEYDMGEEGRWIADDPVPVGANCAVRQADFENLGGFRPGLDRVGRSLVSNGDTEFFRRLRASGGRLWYEPRAHVMHCVPPERLTVAYFLKRQRAQGVSDELLLRLQGHVPTVGHQVGLAREVARAGAMLCADVLRRRDSVRQQLLVSYWIGRLSAARSGAGDELRAATASPTSVSKR